VATPNPAEDPKVSASGFMKMAKTPWTHRGGD
jgi:hypothetical protein